LNPAQFRVAVEERQHRLQAMTVRVGLMPLRRWYDLAFADVAERVRRQPSPHLTMPWVVLMLHAVMGQLARRARVVARDARYTVAVLGGRDTVELTAMAERASGRMAPSPPPGAIERTARTVTDEREPEHDAAHARWLARVLDVLRIQIGLGILNGETGVDLGRRVDASAVIRWPGAETVAKTELPSVYNGTARRVVDILGGRLWYQWQEHVINGLPMDDRVGVDSLALHAQVAPPGGWFTQPPRAPDGQPVQPGLVGDQWQHPPNRPHDRATLVPWRYDWGIPGWIWRDGRRTPVTRRIVDEIGG
jgi:hypothetical protein